MSVHTVVLETMLDAVMCQMEALLLSSAMARRLNLRNLCLVGGLYMSPYFVRWLEQGLKPKFPLTQIGPQERGGRRLPGLHRRLHQGAHPAVGVRAAAERFRGGDEGDARARRHMDRRMNKYPRARRRFRTRN